MKKLKQTKLKVLFLSFLFTLSCSENDEIFEKNKISNDENFVNFSEAKKIASNITFTNFSNKAKKSSDASQKKIESINEVKSDNTKTAFYVINYIEGGYILLSSDKRTQPILAFSEKGKFIVDEKKYPLELKYWIDDTKLQIKEIQNSNIEQSEENKKEWNFVQKKVLSLNHNIASKEPSIECYEHSETLTIGPLLNSTWEQSGGFNDALPYINCYGYPFQVFAGCVPIAMGQVMKYYEYPTNYNWNSIPLNYGTTTTANFIKDIHNAIGSIYNGYPTYDCDATGVSSSANMGNVLKNKFGYASANWGNYDYNIVKDNLNYNRPVILSGDNGSTGHMWVCDGYMQMSFYYDDCTGVTMTPLFHMNWGWGDSSYNAYYSYNNFNPGNTNYNNNKKMIYNIIP
ncbi:MAG: C10 family peptidase [Cloacibacterium caeni]